MKLVRICVAVLALAGAQRSRACVGTDCMQIFSTEDGGGKLAVNYDFEQKKVQTSFAFCDGDCVYNAGDPGFMTPPDSEPPAGGYFHLLDGTNVEIELLSIDPAALVYIGSVELVPNVPVPLGTAPTLHRHPTWLIKVGEGIFGDYPMSFRLTTDSPSYAVSDEIHVLITNLPTPTPGEPEPTVTPTPTPSPGPVDCTGDCDDDGRVTIDELIRGVSAALGLAPMCPALDDDGDGVAEINELVGAVNASLRRCRNAPAPGIDPIQQTIFTPSCAVRTCHDSEFQSGNLVLDGADRSYDELVGVEPDLQSASQLGLLRVDPGNLENSFLLIKVDGPPPNLGMLMPLVGTPLTPAQIQLIRDWIAQGAHR